MGGQGETGPGVAGAGGGQTRGGQAGVTDGARGGCGSVTYGLLGRTLAHSWSPLIHERLGSAPYELVELEPSELGGYVRHGCWKGLNVTIPYKRAAAELADVQSSRVERLGAANTLVRLGNGRILAENTDVPGFSWMLARFCRDRLGQDMAEALDGAKVLVLGSGGASKAVQAALCEAGAAPVVISRQGPERYEGLAERHADAALVVNATPVGMYPNCPASPLDEGVLKSLGALRGILDVIYNPCRTGLCLAAERLGLPFESGLAMLVAQAFFSSELWQGRALDSSLVGDIEAQIRRQTSNVILIGMPGSGKSSCARELSQLTGRTLVDLDDAFSERFGKSAAEVIEGEGEDAFRAKETEVVASVAKKSGLVISCGGGVVCKSENYPLLHQNGTIIMLDRPLSELSSKGRPLSAARGVEALAAERLGLYRTWANHILACTGSARGDALEIRRILGL